MGEPDPKQDPMDKCGQAARRLGSSHFCHVLDSRVLLLLLLLRPGTKKTIAQTAGGRGRTAANTIASNNHPYGQRRQAICSALNQIMDQSRDKTSVDIHQSQNNCTGRRRIGTMDRIDVARMTKKRIGNIFFNLWREKKNDM